MNGPRTLAVDYDLYEIALLAGGPRRAVDAAAVALVESGRVAVDRSNGQLSVQDARRSHALEAALLDAIGTQGHRSLTTVRWRVVNDERLTALRRRLELDELLRPSAAASSRHRRAWQTFALTGEGRRTLRHLRSVPPPDRVAQGTSAMQVALLGVRAMADPDLRSALFDPPAPPRSRNRFAARRDAYAPAQGGSNHSWMSFGGGGDWGGGDGGGGGGGDGGGGC
jgi:uncharacterized membrane protein YgcG